MQAARRLNSATSFGVHQSFRFPFASYWPLVVEPVGELVADGHPGVPVARSVVHLRVVERRLEDAGREVHVVHRGAVIGVHRLRRHVPLAAIHRLADLRQQARRLELHRPRDVAAEVVASELDRRIVTPPVRVADLVRHRLQLLQRQRAGGRGHPLQRLEVLLHRVLDPEHHLQGLPLELRREVLLDEDLSQRLAEIAIHPAHAALPPRRHLLAAGEVPPVEREVLLHEGP